MRKSFRFVLSAVLSASMLLAGCGKSEPSNNTSPAGDSTGTEANVQKGEPVELTMYSWRPEDKEAYQKFIAEFEKDNPNIKVKFQSFKSTEYSTILTNSLQSGTGPDIVQLRPYSGATSVADSGHLVPLDDINGIKEISEAYLDAAKGSDGKIYGVPLSLNSGVIFYNTKLFEENGITVPKTWDEFLEACKTLKSKDIVPIAQSGNKAYLLSLTHAVIGATAYGANDFVASTLKGETNLKDPKFLDSIERMNQLREYFPKDFMAIDDKDAQALFYTGKAAMYINGDYRLESFTKNNPDLPIDVMPSPAAAAGGDTPLVTWVDGSYGLVKFSKHQEEGKKFLEFLASKKFGQMFSDELNRLSAVPGTEPKHPIVKKLTKLGETSATPYLMLVHFGEGTPTTKTTFENALQGLYIDKLNVEQVAAEAQQSAEKWFKAKQ